jgi:hypothetical protein
MNISHNKNVRNLLSRIKTCFMDLIYCLELLIINAFNNFKNLFLGNLNLK